MLSVVARRLVKMEMLVMCIRRLKELPHMWQFRLLFDHLAATTGGGIARDNLCTVRYMPAHDAQYQFLIALADSEFTMFRETGLKCAPMLIIPNPMRPKSLEQRLNVPSK